MFINLLVLQSNGDLYLELRKKCIGNPILEMTQLFLIKYPRYQTVIIELQTARRFVFEIGCYVATCLFCIIPFHKKQTFRATTESFLKKHFLCVFPQIQGSRSPRHPPPLKTKLLTFPRLRFFQRLRLLVVRPPGPAGSVTCLSPSYILSNLYLFMNRTL